MNYDEAKDEALRLMNDDDYSFQQFMAGVVKITRLLVLVYLAVAIYGVVMIHSPWYRLFIAFLTCLVLYAHRKTYGCRNKDPIARLRSNVRGRVPGKE